MGLITKPPYRRRNPLTGFWEWVYPDPEEYDKSDKFKKIDVRTHKKKKGGR